MKKIESLEEYKDYCDRLWTLLKFPNPEDKYTKMLQEAIDEYDKKHHMNYPEMSPIQLLSYFMENHNITKKELAKLLGYNHVCLIDNILDSITKLSEDDITILCDRFKVTRSAFDREYELVNDNFSLNDILIGNPDGNEEWSEEKINRIKAFIEERAAKRTPEQKLKMELLSIKYGVLELIDKYRDEINWRQDNLDRNVDSMGKHFKIRQETSIMNLEDHINDLKNLLKNN